MSEKSYYEDLKQTAEKKLPNEFYPAVKKELDRLVEDGCFDKDDLKHALIILGKALEVYPGKTI